MLVFRSLLIIALIPGANLSSAAITYSGSQNISIPFGFEGVYLDIESASTSGAEFPDWDLNLFFGGEGIVANDSLNPVKTSTASTDPIRKLGLNSSVDEFTLSVSGGNAASLTGLRLRRISHGGWRRSLPG